jgi:predicted glycogen debranching enzyme
LIDFRLDPYPVWTWNVAGVRVEKRVFLVDGQNTVVVGYRASHPALLRVAPFLAYRDYHSLAAANGELSGDVVEDAGVVTVRPYPSLPALRIQHTGGAFVRDGGWYYRTEYREERERGMDYQEDLYRLGTLPLLVGPEDDTWLVASIEPQKGFDPQVLEQAARARRLRNEHSFRGAAATVDPLRPRLARAAEAFRVRRADGTPTIIAGSPWFTDWGRDTMISLPGVLLSAGRLDEAKQVIAGFLAHVDRGLIPNRFPDRGETPEYNTVDATLWMFQAVHAYLGAGGDRRFLLDSFYPAAKEIIRWHQRGTHHGIVVDPADGLLIGGDEGTQLTWMDARVDGRVITPRHGKAVEINALWYNALGLMAKWAVLADDPAQAAAYDQLAETAARSFEQSFWNPARGCLYDVIRPGHADARIRPNQIFAVSLPFPLLSPERRAAVVDVVERELLTPFGLRTLAPGEPGYVPHYRGGPAERDGAYHQGTVWPWLLGPFVRALVRVRGRSADTLARGRALLAGLERHLDEACLGHVSEVFDAEPPHRPGGAPAQAWSVAEPLSLLSVELHLSTAA